MAKDLPPEDKAEEGLSVLGWLGEFWGAINKFDEKT